MRLRALLRLFSTASLVLTFTLTGCSLDSFRTNKTKSSTSGEPENLTYAKELGVDLGSMAHTGSGLYYLDRTIGSGAKAVAGKQVRVAYKGWLANGQLFDQSGENDPIEFQLGAGRVIDGWEEGIDGMLVGGRRLLVIPPALAYGNQSPGAGIPPNATLVFDIVLVGVSP
jgi:FKBP-type peptidyl-prolyl cis-trans isomerase FkpA